MVAAYIVNALSEGKGREEVSHDIESDDEFLPNTHGWMGVYAGAVYTVERSEEGAWILWIAVPAPVDAPFVVDAESGRPHVSESSYQGRGGHVIALLELGANYLDVGYEAEHVAIEIPADGPYLDGELAGKMLPHMVGLYEYSINS